MKTLNLAGETYEAERIVKTETEVVGYVGGTEVFKFSGIRNMDAFTVDGEWDLPTLSTEEELANYKIRLDETENALLSLIDMSLAGGI